MYEPRQGQLSAKFIEVHKVMRYAVAFPRSKYR